MDPVGHHHDCQDHCRLRSRERDGEKHDGLSERGRPEEPVERDEIDVGRVHQDLDRKDQPHGVPLRDEAVDADREQASRDGEVVREGYHERSSLSTLASATAPKTEAASTSASTSRMGPNCPVRICPMPSKLGAEAWRVAFASAGPAKLKTRERARAAAVTTPVASAKGFGE